MHLSPRLILQIDALTCGAMAVLLLAMAGPLSDWLSFPVDLLRGIGLFLVPWTAFLAWLSSRSIVSQGSMRAVIAVNALWIVGSFVLLVSGQVDPNRWGVAFVIVQALAVAVLIGIQVKSLPQTTSQQPAM